MRNTDLDSVMELEKSLQNYVWPKEAFAQAIRLKHFCIVVEENNQIVGYGVADLVRGHGRTICAKTPAVALRLYKAWFDKARAIGSKELHAEIEPSNIAARNMLEHYGFKAVGQVPHFYGVDRLAEVYVKEL